MRAQFETSRVRYHGRNTLPETIITHFSTSELTMETFENTGKRQKTWLDSAPSSSIWLFFGFSTKKILANMRVTLTCLFHSEFWNHVSQFISTAKFPFWVQEMVRFWKNGIIFKKLVNFTKILKNYFCKWPLPNQHGINPWNAQLQIR